MKPRAFVIAVDGPAAAGKGTLTRALAEKLGYERLDSGRLYRSVAKHVVDEWQLGDSLRDSLGDSLGDPSSYIEAIAQAVRTRLPLTRLHLAAIGKDPRLDDDTIALLASRLAPHAILRAVLREQQCAYIASVDEGIVLDGRDMGTVIAPDAPCKIFLTASSEARAKRRVREMLDRGAKENYDDLLNSVREAMRARDERDLSRAEAPLKAAKDALVLDSSALSVEQVLEHALHHVKDCTTRLLSRSH